MNIWVVQKLVPDTVEELAVAADQKSLEAEGLRFKVSDPDAHALEQALLLKERYGGKVTVVALAAPELEEALFTALAGGADRAVKLSADQTRLGTVATAGVLAAFFGSGTVPIGRDTLILPGAQAYDDLEGELGPYLAEALHLPYLGVVCSVQPAEGKVVVLKEFSGGVRGEFEVTLPAVLGIQSADKPPRYIPIAKIRAIQKTVKIETVDLPAPARPASVAVERLYKPESAGGAEMLEGRAEEVAERIAEILAERGLV